MSRGNAAELVGVSKAFQGRRVVDSIDLSVDEHSFFSILGPSGCGKTTTLRMLGGFVRPDAGQVRIGGRDVTAAPPHRRDVNTVFQSYALFGHLSVADNVAFGLKRKKVPRAEVRERVTRMLEVVSLGERGSARPSELSGGQQQRVALARALVNSPGLLLLDEPLGALDLKLRRQMQVELKAIQQEVQVAFVYVTHDQEEALTMSDRIAVMNEGRILQTGTPADIYDAPSTLFVAEFIGTTNSLPGVVRDDRVELACGAAVAAPRGAETGSRIVACVRPEKVLLQEPRGEAPTGCGARATVAEAVYLGSGVSYRLATETGESLTASVPIGSGRYGALPVGQRVDLRWLPEDSRLFRANDGASLDSRADSPGPSSGSTTVNV